MEVTSVNRPKDRSNFIFKSTYKDTHKDNGHHQPGATDVVIVSAFGRGDWMAGELANQGWKVSLVDVTSHLSVDPEAMIDAEGPFGLFSCRELPPSYQARFFEESDLLPVESGFALWLGEGPIEFVSQLTKLQLARAEVSKPTIEYLRQKHEPGSREGKRSYRQVMQEPYRSNWPAGLAHQMASSLFSENHLALESGTALPFFSPYAIRQPTVKGREWTHNTLRARGVFVRYPARPLDVRVTGKVVDAIEIQDEFGGVEQAKSYVWMLTTAETRQLSSRAASNITPSEPGALFTKLFPGGCTQPTWYWQRLRVDLQGTHPDDALPAAFVVMDDVFLPWTHSNLVVMRRRREARAFDAWLKLPMRIRNDKTTFDEYLLKLAGEIEERLRARMPLLEPRFTVPPLALRGQEVLPTPSMAIFAEDPFLDLEVLAVDNFFFCGPERWVQLDWLHAYRHQMTIIARLERLKERWEAEARRQAAREERQKARRGSSGGEASP